MTSYVKNPKEFTNKPPTTITDFSKVTEYNVNIQKSIVFLYMSNKNNIKSETLINLTKHVKDLDPENY